jgi:hypothetical protein
MVEGNLLVCVLVAAILRKQGRRRCGCQGWALEISKDWGSRTLLKEGWKLGFMRGMFVAPKRLHRAPYGFAVDLLKIVSHSTEYWSSCEAASAEHLNCLKILSTA